MIRFTILLFLALASKLAPVTIRVEPAVVYVDQSLTVVCRVPRDAGNRKIVARLMPDSSGVSERQLDGTDKDLVTHRFDFKHISADVTSAQCSLINQYGEHADAVAAVLVIQP